MISLGDLEQRLRDFGDAVRARISSALASFLMDTYFTATAEGRSLTDAVEGFENSEGGAPANIDAFRMEMAGVLIIPLPREPATKIGSGATPKVFPLASDRYRPRNGKRGDIALYCLSKEQAQLWLRATGVVTVDAASGKDIVLNGGSRKASGVGDRVNMGKWAVKTAMVAGTTVVTEIDWIEPGILFPVPLTTTPQELDGTVKTGTDHVKIP